MNDSNISEGQRFSLTYLRTDETLRDSNRMRFRVSKLFSEYAPSRNDLDTKFGNLVERELGIKVLTSGYSGSKFIYESVLQKAEIRDVLDMITLLFRFVASRGNSHPKMLAEARRIFGETQVGYRIDGQGGVHPAFDNAFEVARAAAVKGLSGPENTVEREFIENAELAFMQHPVDGRQAIRSIFDAVENFFKKMYPGTTHLNKASINEKLKPEVEAPYSDISKAIPRNSSVKSVESFRQWVDGAHFFRHAAGQPEPTQPSVDHAILVVSQGLAFLRWLAALRTSRTENTEK